jgi:TDG/mug DNA glycosylase family protein
VSDLTHGFPPIAGTDARVLVLGSLPSRKSLETNQYYGHPQNAFWRIMGELFGAGREQPYEERIAILVTNRVAVWDVLKASVRPGSMDADIDLGAAVPNDFAAFLNQHPALELVCFNGKTAEKMFERLVAPVIENRSNRLQYMAMPSTSPAFASMSFEQKLDQWRVVRNVTEGTGGEQE